MNHEKYTQSILAGVKTWAQSLFVTKERAKDLYYTEQGKVALLKDQSLSFVDQGGIYIAEITDNDIVNLGSGETITISFDGEDYECVTSEISPNDDLTLVVAGNLALGNAGEDTGEPFLLMVMPGNMAQIGTSLTDTTHKVGIYAYGDIVHKIKPKYLPDHTHDWSDLPELPSNAIVFDAVRDDVDSISVDVSYAYLYERLVTNKEDPAIVLRLRKNSDSYYYEFPIVLYCEKWMHGDGRFFVFEFHDGAELYAVGIYSGDDVFMEIYSEYDVTDRVSIGEGLIHDDNGAIAVDPYGTREGVILTDSITGYDYIVQMRNGSLVSFCKCDHIEVTTMPTRTEYVSGEKSDISGMVISSVTQDGSSKIIENYDYDEYIMSDCITVTYTEAGISYTAIVPLTVTEFDPATVLVDFEYTTNDDGTYTITAWKETLNGEPSTEMVIPNNHRIIV